MKVDDVIAADAAAPVEVGRPSIFPRPSEKKRRQIRRRKGSVAEEPMSARTDGDVAYGVGAGVCYFFDDE